MKLSILIPHKDSPEFLKRLLDTIPSDDDIEVLVIDDHSDHGPQVVTSEHPNVHLIPNRPERKGAGSARNTGLAQARGEWILFADADDRFLPGAFDVIRSHLNDRADIVYFRPESEHQSAGSTATRHSAYADLVEKFPEDSEEWIRYRFHPPWSKLIRRELLTKYSIHFAETPAGDDVLFSLKVGLEADKINAVNEPIYCVTQGNSNALTRRLDEHVINARLHLHCTFNNLLRERGRWKYRMTVLPVLRKSWRLSPGTFFRSLAFCLYNRQPIFDNWAHLKMLWLRRHGDS